MPLPSRWAIRAAFVHLLVGFTLGGLLLSHRGIPLWSDLDRLIPAHVEILLFGWLVQLALGVGYWILPRLRGPTPRGGVAPFWVALGALNAGVLLVTAAALPGAPATLAPTGRVLEAAAALAFAFHAWPRIRAYGT